MLVALRLPTACQTNPNHPPIETTVHSCACTGRVYISLSSISSGSFLLSSYFLSIYRLFLSEHSRCCLHFYLSPAFLPGMTPESKNGSSQRRPSPLRTRTRSLLSSCARMGRPCSSCSLYSRTQCSDKNCRLTCLPGRPDAFLVLLLGEVQTLICRQIFHQSRNDPLCALIDIDIK